VTATAALPRDYATIALNYARDVVDGRILACRWVILACKRHLNDLERVGMEAFPYRFDETRGSVVCEFVELLPHTKGKWARGAERIHLESWQVFFIAVLFGWVHAESGLRRFRKAYLCVPRKNGKSIIAGGIGLYMFSADGEFGAEVYTGATTEKQAWEVFRPARLMALKTPDFTEQFGVEVNAANLNIPGDGSRFEPLIGKPGDGASPSCAIVDEYHEHDSDDLVDTMETGMGAREQPLTLIITTAGTDIASPCFALQQDLQKVLDGLIENDALFGAIYTIDEKMDWTSDLALRMANPNYDVSVSGEYLRAQIRTAIQSARKQNTIKTKHLNIWCNARSPWMNMEKWNACADPTLKEADFEGDRCVVALDLASKLDVASQIKVFRREIDGVEHYYGFGRYYLPESRASDPDRQHYQEWMHKHLLTVTDGNIIDYGTIFDDIIDDGHRFELAEIAADPWNATKFLQDLQAEGHTVVEFPQTTQRLSDAMKELEALVVAENAKGEPAPRFHHDGNPILAWMMSNVTVKPDAKDNIFPRKDRPESKIDGAVACIMATARAIVMNDDGEWSVV
jgi:phage terminase large subunit-like protein